MPWKESEAVPEGNGPVPRQEEFRSGEPTLAGVYRLFEERFKKMDSYFDRWNWKLDEIWDEMRMMDQHVTSLERGARQPRLAMEADGLANTKTRERMEGAASAVQAIRGDNFSACRVEPDPMTSSTGFGMISEPPALSCRDDVVVESGDAAPKSCLSFLEMRSLTASGGLIPTCKISTATETTINEPLLHFYSTEEANCKKIFTPYVLYYSSVWNLLAAFPCLRVIETKSGENRMFGPGGFPGRLRPCPVLGSWRVAWRGGCACRSRW